MMLPRSSSPTFIGFAASNAMVFVATTAYLLWRFPPPTFFLSSLDHGYQLAMGTAVVDGRLPGIDYFTLYGPFVGLTSGLGLERSPSELNRGRDSRIGFDLLEDRRRGKEAAGMALSDDLRERVVGAVVEGGMSRNAAAKRFGVSIASAVRWVARFKAKGEISPAPTGGDRRSGRIEALRDYLFGLIGRRPDMTLLEIQERLIANCGERFSSSVLWRFFDRHGLTFKKSPRTPRSSNARTF